MIKTLNITEFFLCEEAWKYLGILSTLRSVTSGVHESTSGTSTCCPWHEIWNRVCSSM